MWQKLSSFALNFSRFKPALNWNRLLGDLRRGPNSLNSVTDNNLYYYIKKKFIWSNRFHSLTMDCKDIEIRKSEFVAKTLKRISWQNNKIGILDLDIYFVLICTLYLYVLCTYIYFVLIYTLYLYILCTFPITSVDTSSLFSKKYDSFDILLPFFGLVI